MAEVGAYLKNTACLGVKISVKNSARFFAPLTSFSDREFIKRQDSKSILLSMVSNDKLSMYLAVSTKASARPISIDSGGTTPLAIGALRATLYFHLVVRRLNLYEP